MVLVTETAGTEGAGEGGERKELGENEQEAIHFVPEAAHAFIRCPACGSPDFEISKGRGVWVERITGMR